jgi:hypothetical protein
MNSRSLTFVLALAGLFGPRAWADTVYLKNADRLTGTIDKLEAGKLYLETSYAGTIGIGWENVASVASDQPVKIQSGAGLVVTGIISGNDEAMEVRTERHGVVALTGITAILRNAATEEAGGLWSKLSSSVDLGMSLTRGNSHANQFSVNATTRYRGDALQVVVELDSLFSKSSDTLGASRHSASVRLDRYLSPTHFTFLLGSMERDDGERLALRRNFGGGLGWQMWNSRRLQLSVLAGSTLFSERFRDPEVGKTPSEGGTELLFAVNLDKALIGRNVLTSKFSVYPDLLRSGHVRTSLDTALRIPLAGPVTLSLRAFERFNNAPQAATKAHDYGFLSSFGVTF